MDKITALIATIPSRKHQLRVMINSIIDQVDEIKIVLNGYHNVPPWLKNEKITCEIDCAGDMKANAVWRFTDSLEGYVFVVDDDIIYPPDYVAKMVALLAENDNKVVACVHGKWLTLPFKNLHTSVSLNHFRQRNEAVAKADIAGVGTVAYHTGVLAPTFADISFSWFRDYQFSAYVARCGVKILRVVRPSEWLKAQATNDLSLCDRVLNDGHLTKLANDYVKRCIVPYILE